MTLSSHSTSSPAVSPASRGPNQPRLSCSLPSGHTLGACSGRTEPASFWPVNHTAASSLRSAPEGPSSEPLRAAVTSCHFPFCPLSKMKTCYRLPSAPGTRVRPVPLILPTFSFSELPSLLPSLADHGLASRFLSPQFPPRSLGSSWLLLVKQRSV